MTEILAVGRRRVAISHPERVVFPDSGLTKLDLARHYATVGEVMVPHVRGRPLALQSFPQGIAGGAFFLKDAPGHFPDWIPTVAVPKREGGTIDQVLADEVATLVYLAGQNVITPHVWMSRADRLDRPDRLVLDLDPTEDDFGQVKRAAAMVADLFRDAGLEPFAMLTGSRGVHVVAPIRRELAFPEVFALSRGLARAAVERCPDVLTTEFHKENREAKIFVDDLRNRYAQTVVPPYAVRARPEATVATPIAWDELAEAEPRHWTVRNIGERAGDAWADIAEAAVSPRSAARAVEKL